MKTPETSKHFAKVVDPHSGAPHYVLKTKLADYQQGFYFVNNSMTRDGRYLWFYAIPNPVYTTMNRHLGYVDFLTDEVVICYDCLFNDSSPYIDAETGDAYFTHGNKIYLRHPGKDEKAVALCHIPIDGYFSQISTHLTRASDGYTFLLDIRREEFGYVLGTVDIRSGEFTEWSRSELCTNHAQLNPRCDTLALCACDGWFDFSGNKRPVPYDEHGNYMRLWTATKDGGRKMYPPKNNYATHEWWSDDGKKIYYCSDNYGIYGINLDTGADITVLEGVDPWHAHCTKDESLFVYDEKKLDRYGGKWYRGCPAAVNFLNRRTGKRLVVVTEMPENGHTPENQNLYHIDPHPRFTENEKYIVFSTSELGGCDLAVAAVDELIELTQ